MKQNYSLGAEISHFRLVQIQDLPDYQATGYLFVHDKTGMEACFVENQDSEQFFSYVVRTIPTDDTGVPHILEHSTLSGSRLYPVHDPFMDLEKGSTNTYLNAMTYPDKTVYLAASPLTKDFSNLFSVYTDAVFHPLLRKEAFQQEGIRLVNDAKGLRWEGVVFNEMLGASADHDELLARSVIKALYPDDCFRFDAGGDPCAIVHLTYEGYLNFYREHYHPSNCRLLVYGDNDISAMLAFLEDGYLKEYRRSEALPPVSLCPKWHGSSRIVAGPKDGEGKKNDASILVAWRTTDASDPLEVVTLDTLSDLLLDDPSCPLYKALLESGLGEDVSPESGMVADFPQMPFMAGFKGIEPGKEQAVLDLVQGTLGRIAEEGIGSEAIEGRLKRSRFKQQEIAGSVPQGLRVMDRCLAGWMSGKGPFVTMQIGPALDALDEALSKEPRYFEHWMERNLLNNPKRVVISVYPDDSYLKTQQGYLVTQANAALKEDADLEKETQTFLSYENTPDSAEAHARVPRLSIRDLPVNIKPNEYQTHLCMGRPVYTMRQVCNGIVYFSMSVSVDDLQEDEFRFLSLYTRLLLETGIGKLNEREAALKMKKLFGGVTILVDSDGDIKTHQSRATVTLKLKMLKEDVSEALAFATELWLHANVTDVKRIHVALGDLKGDYRDSVTYGASSFASQYAVAPFTQAAWESEEVGGVTQWAFLANLQRMDEVAVMMERLQKKLSNRTRMSFHLTGDAPEVLLDSLSRFLSAFSDEAISSNRRKYALLVPGEKRRTAFSLPSNVSYCALAQRSDPVSSPLQVAQVVLGQIMTTNDLWSKIRMKGGAYGVVARADLSDGLFQFITYRDPRISESFQDYRKVLERYAREAPSEEEIENAKISLIGLELKPLGPSQVAEISFKRILMGYDDQMREERRKQLLAVDGKQVTAAASRLLELLDEENAMVVFTSRKMLQKDGRFSFQLNSLPL
ncbi:MAG: insulinase family protein [Sphaerochaetaceae bacterium]